MKTILAASAIALFLAGCGVNTSGNIDFNASHIKYTQDPRTELCYAYVASRKTAKVDTSGLGLTNVPCSNEVMKLVD